MIKLGVLTAAWKRYDVLELFCKAVNRYRKHPDIKVIPVVSVSEKETFKICKRYKIKTVKTDNFPLSDKFQKGLTDLKKSRPDYVLNLGSDDIICDRALDAYINQMNNGIDFIGLSSCYFYNRLTGELFYWPGYKNYRQGESGGIGRCISASLLEKVNWRLWNCSINRGLDSCMSKTLSNESYSRAKLDCLKDDMMAIDIKDSQSITSVKQFPKLPRVRLSLLKYYLPNEYQEITNPKYRGHL